MLPLDDGVVFGAFLRGDAHGVALVGFVFEGVGGEPGVHRAQQFVGGAMAGGELVFEMAREGN